MRIRYDKKTRQMTAKTKVRLGWSLIGAAIAIPFAAIAILRGMDTLLEALLELAILLPLLGLVALGAHLVMKGERDPILRPDEHSHHADV